MPPSRVVGVVRYDGDPDVFTALAATWLRQEGYEASILPPDPRLYRWNVDPTGYHPQVLGWAERPGPGAWLGAVIECARPPGTGPVVERYCHVCDGRRGERHGGFCVIGRQKAREGSRG